MSNIVGARERQFRSVLSEAYRAYHRQFGEVSILDDRVTPASLIAIGRGVGASLLMTRNSITVNTNDARDVLMCLHEAAVMLHITQTTTGSPVNAATFKHTQDEGADLFVAKNHDYGDAFATCGVIGVMIRVMDKIMRLDRMLGDSPVTAPRVADESVRDTILDIVNYSVMGVMLIDEATTAAHATPI